ncbi:MAG TPA: sigma-70 family RNA polymerase sigma factor [Archangium sp.]
MSTRRRAEFEAWLEARTPRSQWGELNLEDLELCWGALRQDRLATIELERRLQRIAQGAVKGDDEFLAEVLQRVRQRLLVGDKPRLAAYQGRGALVQYLKAVVLSVSIDLKRAARPAEEAGDDALFAATAGEENVVTRLAQQAHRQHFTAAFKDALETLSAEERTWLRMRFVDGLSVEAVGAAFGVHRTTAMRRLEKAQEQLMAETKRLLGKRLKLPARELDSVLRGLRPSLAENLSRLLPKL